MASSFFVFHICTGLPIEKTQKVDEKAWPGLSVGDSIIRIHPTRPHIIPSSLGSQNEFSARKTKGHVNEEENDIEESLGKSMTKETDRSSMTQKENEKRKDKKNHDPKIKIYNEESKKQSVQDTNEHYSCGSHLRNNFEGAGIAQRMKDALKTNIHQPLPNFVPGMSVLPNFTPGISVGKERINRNERWERGEEDRGDIWERRHSNDPIGNGWGNDYGGRNRLVKEEGREREEKYMKREMSLRRGEGGWGGQGSLIRDYHSHRKSPMESSQWAYHSAIYEKERGRSRGNVSAAAAHREGVDQQERRGRSLAPSSHERGRSAVNSWREDEKKPFKGISYEKKGTGGGSSTQLRRTDILYLMGMDKKKMQQQQYMEAQAEKERLSLEDCTFTPVLSARRGMDGLGYDGVSGKSPDRRGSSTQRVRSSSTISARESLGFEKSVARLRSANLQRKIDNAIKSEREPTFALHTLCGEGDSESLMVEKLLMREEIKKKQILNAMPFSHVGKVSREEWLREEQARKTNRGAFITSLNVLITGGKSGRLSLYANDNPKSVVAKFSKVYGKTISEDAKLKLYEVVSYHINNYRQQHASYSTDELYTSTSRFQ